MELPQKVYSRKVNGQQIVGKPTGSTRVCRLEGCTGRRMGVRWSDGKLTFPCTKGMKWSPKGRVATII